MTAQGNAVRWEATLDQAREKARREGKPILLDFTAAPM